MLSLAVSAQAAHGGGPQVAQARTALFSLGNMASCGCIRAALDALELPRALAPLDALDDPLLRRYSARLLEKCNGRGP